MYYYLGHLLLAFLWAIFLLTFIKSMQNQNLTESKLFGILSIITMIVILIVGTKMMLNDHSIIKSGKWIHVKLSLDIILMLENLFLLKILKQGKFVSSKCGNIMYFFSLFAFLSMIILTMLRPF
jgi:uncharacterized membrane protein